MSYTGFEDSKKNKLHVGDSVRNGKLTGIIKHEEREGHYIHFENGMKYRLEQFCHRITKILGG